MLKKVVFLDRDGVINQDSADYIKSREEFKWIPGSLEAIRILTAEGFSVILITNQSVIGRKMVTAPGLDAIHAMLVQKVESAGGKILDIFFCPHTDEDRCACRKPRPGLIHMAQKAHDIDLKSAVMVGDSVKDIECAQNAGCFQSILVRTGSGKESEKILKARKIEPDHVADDLYGAAGHIAFGISF
ncbi:D-glycero-beta-D-manno-heptose-1,7-bisphosphate 7-phosphatase [Candidatus Desulfarcum epimagneticum]|uniref:D,D-heptose 1,7-bisphosphate phosphatase n=1 Tax=uncultured Desulfobacteraceae bacterium TaxID=218296 RepID=A0A484HEC6_9BACT|nr:D-glycero-beta-D-manno-heptose-1,7-bisphosphate 7-phosphatase [uncultured Desulfobacteraceae bacterium]